MKTSPRREPPLRKALPGAFLFKITLETGPAFEIPRGKEGAMLSICPFTGGSFAGPRVRGRVLPGGGDWAAFRGPDTFDIDVRAMLQADDGALVDLRYAGVWRAEPGTLAPVLAAGGHSRYRPRDHHVRVAARFETASPRLAWLNSILAVGMGGLTASGGVEYDFFTLL